MDYHILKNIFYQYKKKCRQECIFCFPLPEIILKDFGDLYLLLDTCPLVSGHVLLSSKKHYGCLGDLPQKDIETAEKILHSLSSDFIVYEHGRAGSCGTFSANCEHFHMNIIPIKKDIHSLIDSKFKKLSSLFEVQDFYNKFGNYLLIMWNGFFYVKNSERESIPPHYLRTLFCELLKTSHLADWENYDDPNLFVTSYALTRELYDIF